MYVCVCVCVCVCVLGSTVVLSQWTAMWWCVAKLQAICVYVGGGGCFFDCKSCKILVPWQGLNPRPLQKSVKTGRAEAYSLKHQGVPSRPVWIDTETYSGSTGRGAELTEWWNAAWSQGQPTVEWKAADLIFPELHLVSNCKGTIEAEQSPVQTAPWYQRLSRGIKQ